MRALLIAVVGAAALWSVPAEASHWHVWPYFGFGYGAESATIPYLVGRYFGMQSFGEIYSYLFITVPLGGALGPYLMGAGFDRGGSYQLVLLFCGVATVVAALALLRLGSYPVFSKTISR